MLSFIILIFQRLFDIYYYYHSVKPSAMFSAQLNNTIIYKIYEAIYSKQTIIVNYGP